MKINTLFKRNTIGFLLAVVFIHTPFLAGAETVQITVHADQPIGELRPIWNYFGYDEALTTLTPEGQHLLGELNKLSDTDPIRIRVHHLLTSGDGTLALKWSSTDVYNEDADGNPIYNWERMDLIMDELTKPGIEPFVQAGFMPQDLSSQPEPYTPELTQRGLPRNMVSGGAFFPPKDYQKWQDLIAAWAQHCVERYGREAAESWLWEPWNEPESPYFRGTVEDYCRLYDHFAAGVKSVLPNARVGGPHVTDPGWRDGDEFMMAFLEHCRSGVNAATGGTGSPLDFIAYHAKGTTRLDNEGRVEMNLRNQLSTINTYSQIIASFPEFAGLPIYIGESDPEGCAGCPATLDPERDYRRTSQFAAYSAAAFMRKQDLIASHGGNLQGAVSWAFTFHNQPWFNGLRALTSNEVALPVFNAFKLFAQMGDGERVAVENPRMLPVEEIITNSVRGASDIGAVAKRDSILLWNFHDVAGLGDTVDVELTINGSNATSATITRIDETHANAYTVWREIGEPQDPTVEQIAALHAAAGLQEEPFEIERADSGNVTTVIALPPQSVVLVKLR